MSGFQRFAGNSGSSQSQTETQESPKTAIDGRGKVFKVPDFTIKDILSAIPPECYQRNLATSLAYVARDILLMVSMGLVAHGFVAPRIASAAWILRFAFWNVYAAAMGAVGTGLWVLAHECGHQAFSDYGAVNDFVGWILHSYLMVPYFSWKYSHSKHHKTTGNLDRDMVFVPPTKEEFKSFRGITANLAECTEDSPLRTLGELVLQQLGGWIAYLFTNVTGQKHEDSPAWKRNHFWPTSPLFESKDAVYIALSDLGILVQSLVLRMWYVRFGGWSLFINWFVPYLWVNHWLVFITYLQHTDPALPHYEGAEWNFAKGAAATIDRKFGFIGPHIFHDIIETHVLHHYVSRIPFYNARPATEAIKKVMGDHYQFSDENMFKSLWSSARACQYVDGTEGVMMFRNLNNLGVGVGEK
ncbi:LADA_0E11870g1_1 [Lachancea dasiensis]|uniref:LADA_0E11870g1_1 n=1 Tax=Lachancea dasiensis TaxID=1072105 RepID=A0A1G4JFI0_9SACH|nr:LADA_0E11870g1_1 [Lachancea dasiensis]